jgi:hypothetical protein
MDKVALVKAGALRLGSHGSDHGGGHSDLGPNDLHHSRNDFHRDRSDYDHGRNDPTAVARSETLVATAPTAAPTTVPEAKLGGPRSYTPEGERHCVRNEYASCTTWLRSSGAPLGEWQPYCQSPYI